MAHMHSCFLGILFDFFLECPIWLPVFSYFSVINQNWVYVEIDPGMALTPLPSSIGRGSNPRPSDREPSALPLDHSFRLFLEFFSFS
jgi:hypothetical protein